MRCDMEDALEAKVARAYRELVIATNQGLPRRVRENLARRVSRLRELLKRAERMPT